MRLTLTKNINTSQTIIFVPLTLSPLCLLFLIRLGVYIVNLCVFYFVRLVEKLTVFLEIQDFRLCNLPMVSSTTDTRCSPHSSNLKSATSLPRLQHYTLHKNIDGVPIVSKSHSPITLYNLSSINLVCILRCSSPPNNPVYVRRDKNPNNVRKRDVITTLNDVWERTFGIIPKPTWTPPRVPFFRIKFAMTVSTWRIRITLGSEV